MKKIKYRAQCFIRITKEHLHITHKMNMHKIVLPLKLAFDEQLSRDIETNTKRKHGFKNFSSFIKETETSDFHNQFQVLASLNVVYGQSWCGDKENASTEKTSRKYSDFPVKMT